MTEAWRPAILAAMVTGTLRLTLVAVPIAAMLYACSPTTGVGSQASAVQTTEDETNGYVVMDANRRLFIYYDDQPGTVISSLPGEASYRSFLERAGDIRPGQRRRIAQAIATYVREIDGSYSISEYMHAEGTVAEPGVRKVGSRSPEYRCYQRFLGDLGPGQHHLLLRDWRAINRCVQELS